MIRNTFNYIVVNFGFSSLDEFINSTIHSKLILLTIPLASISGIIELYTGLHYLTILSFGLLVFMEFLTGIYASKIKNLPIESRKFGRFGLKLLVWLSLMFILNSLKIEYGDKEGLTNNMSFGLFSWLHSSLYVYVNLEYLISVLENIEVINGSDPNTSKLGKLKKKMDSFLDKLFS